MDWHEFLSGWSVELAERGRLTTPPDSRQPWAGEPPATEAAIAAVEARLGFRLPSSYREFLLVSDGWAFLELGWPAHRLLSVAEIATYAELDAPTTGARTVATSGSYRDAQEQWDLWRRSVVISSPDGADRLVIDPTEVPGQDGYWCRWSGSNSRHSDGTFVDVMREARGELVRYIDVVRPDPLLAPISPLDWPTFLSRWRRELGDAGLLDEWDPHDPMAGVIGASEEAIAAAEARLGTRLPPSYRTFLTATDGWPVTGYWIVPGFRGVADVGWFRDVEASWYEIWRDLDALNHALGEDVALMERALVVSDPDSYKAVLLDPANMDPVTGEWRRWHLSNGGSGSAVMGPEFSAELVDAYTSFHDDPPQPPARQPEPIPPETSVVTTQPSRLALGPVAPRRPGGLHPPAPWPPGDVSPGDVPPSGSP